MKAVDLHIDGMTCAACSSRIEKVLRRLPGVTAEVSLLERRARVSGLTMDEAIAAVRRAGYDARPLDLWQSRKADIGQDHVAAADRRAIRFLESFRFWFSMLALAIMAVEMLGMALGHHGLIPLGLQLLLATVMQSVVAWPFYRSALRAARAGGANMETLISIGTLAAYVWSVLLVSDMLPQSDIGHGSVYFETSVVVLAMVRLGRTLERRARGRALQALSALTDLDQSPVAVFIADDQTWREQSPQSIPAGSLIRLAPNQAISLDAVITEGQTEIDESSMTGESLPVTKHVGDTLFAGCRNLSGQITARVLNDFTSSRRALIGQRILAALSSRAPIAALADRIASWFVPVVLLISLATLGGHLAAGTLVTQAISYAVAVLVVACPCALGLATPAAIAAGLARGAQLGWYFRSADALQRASQIHHVVFDKTGTLTSGRPALLAIAGFDSESPDVTARIQVMPLATASDPRPWPQWLAAASAAEQGIEHPLAGALLSYVAGRPMPQCKEVQHHPGDGVSAVMESGAFADQAIHIGKPAWVLSEGFSSRSAAADFMRRDDWQQVESLYSDASAIDVAIGGRWRGRIWISDSIRPDAQQAISELKNLGLQTTIVSGDRQAAVGRVARALGGLEFLYGQTPEDKSRHLDALRQAGQRVAMVGDGINDAAAMAHAHLGIAMASGAALTLQSADLTISTPHPLHDAVSSLGLSNAVMRRVRQNLAFAFVFNIAAIPLAALGMLAPAIAGSAMALSSAAVVANALGILQWRKSKPVLITQGAHDEPQ